jgi:hypothetical protein
MVRPSSAGHSDTSDTARPGNVADPAWILTSMVSEMDDDVATVVHLERRLLESSVRASAASLEALLDPEFQVDRRRNDTPAPLRRASGSQVRESCRGRSRRHDASPTRIQSKA